MSSPSCPYCKDTYEKVGGNDVLLDWRCTRCGTTTSAERVHDVYDAAMALYRSSRTQVPAALDLDYKKIIELMDVCRAAEEVERV